MSADTAAAEETVPAMPAKKRGRPKKVQPEAPVSAAETAPAEDAAPVSGVQDEKAE